MFIVLVLVPKWAPVCTQPQALHDKVAYQVLRATLGICHLEVHLPFWPEPSKFPYGRSWQRAEW